MVNFVHVLCNSFFGKKIHYARRKNHLRWSNGSRPGGVGCCFRVENSLWWMVSEGTEGRGRHDRSDLSASRNTLRRLLPTNRMECP